MKKLFRGTAVASTITVVLLVVVSGSFTAGVGEAQSAGYRLMVTNSMGEHISIVEPEIGEVEQFAVGPAPWGIALTEDGRAFVSTAAGVAVFDIASETVVASVPYLTGIDAVRFGEYRAGGMGIVASPDGERVYVGVHVNTGPGWLEVLDTQSLEMLSRVHVGVRPFDVAITPDGSEVYSIDHDSYTVTVVDTFEMTTHTIDVAPLGYGGFDKPHYGKVLLDGTLLLPYQGKVMLELDPGILEPTSRPLTSDTHMHGISTNAAETCAVIVGTGPAGSASGSPGLTLLDLDTGAESILPLDKPHEMTVVSDDCTTAYVTGGYSFANGGWDGISIVDLGSGTVTEVPVPDRPLWIVFVPERTPAS
ncbi:hypothetical protein BH24CHL4_BH24CHL4_06880 [soil metagenome]